MPLRALVVDDTILYRRIVSEALSTIPGVSVIGSVGHGRAAVERIAALEPDLVALDLEMPVMTGLEVLDALREAPFQPTVIVVSAYSFQGGALTVQALEKGAFDFVTKPAAGTAGEARRAIHEALAPMVAAVMRTDGASRARRAPPPAPQDDVAAPVTPAEVAAAAVAPADVPARGIQFVLIGVSTGGPRALARVLPALPHDLGVPIVVVQHMPTVFTRALADSLARKAAIRVCEASDHERLEPNVAYIAPGGAQMKLVRGAHGAAVARITDDPPEHHCKPSVDYLFRSVAEQFPGVAMAVIMTGMGSDGVLGLQELRRHGCYAIAQDEASSVVYGMPKAAFDADVVDQVVPLDGIAARIVAAVRGRPG